MATTANSTKKQARQPLTEWLEELTEKTGVGITHGDYQRIANLTLKENGKPYTADYIRKVILGLRNNPVIYKKAKKYYKLMVKVEAQLRDFPEPKLGHER